MKKIHFTHILSSVLAGLMLIGCASQTADSPLPTITVGNTSSVTTHSAASASITTAENTPVVTTGSGDDALTSTVNPGTTKDTPTTAPAPSESETEASATTSGADIPFETTPQTAANDPITDPPASGQTPTTSPTSSQTPTPSKAPDTSKTPATTTRAETTTTTKKAASQTPATTAETPIPTPHTHSWSSWKTTKAATCTANGTESRTCATCGNTETKNISSTGHSWGDWKVTTEPTTSTEGIETRTCSKCQSTETRKIDKLPSENATPEDCEWMANYFLQLLNEERKKAGVQTLVTDAKMHEMAQVRADELTVEFSHIRPDNKPCSTVFRDFEYGNFYDMTIHGLPASYNYYSPSYFDEDIGAGAYGYGITMQNIIDGIMLGFKNSPGHWQSLMNGEFGAVGVAVSVVDDNGWHYTYVEVLLADKLY